MASDRFVVPGDCIASAEEDVIAGNGTYVLNDYLYSTLAGTVQQRIEDGKTIIEVTREGNKIVVPEEGNVVLAKITAVKRRYCKCAICEIEGHPIREPLKGVIRREDARQKEKDIDMYKSFRTGDLVLARIKNLGTEQGYLLSTAENELGVVLAHSKDKVPMVPLSFTEMVCPKTFEKQQRKVAKILPPMKSED